MKPAAALSPRADGEVVKALAEGWTWEVVSVGIPTPVHGVSDGVVQPIEGYVVLGCGNADE